MILARLVFARTLRRKFWLSFATVPPSLLCFVRGDALVHSESRMQFLTKSLFVASLGDLAQEPSTLAVAALATFSKARTNSKSWRATVAWSKPSTKPPRESRTSPLTSRPKGLRRRRQRDDGSLARSNKASPNTSVSVSSPSLPHLTPLLSSFSSSPSPSLLQIPRFFRNYFVHGVWNS